MARILYISHDNPRPSGGIRTLYRHVEILRSAGLNAYIVHHQRGFRVGWFESTAPLLYAEGGLALHPADWVVMPEDHSAALEGFRHVGCRKAVFCQGHYHIFDFIPPRSSWADYGVSEVLVSSLPIRDFVRAIFNVEPAYVPLSLDLELFRPGVGCRQLQIAFMPRKGAGHLRLIEAVLRHRAPDLGGIPWVAIEGLGEVQVAAMLAQSVFFLSTGVREGFGLPPLEAMACGSMVCGFRGGGGAEYATQNNGFWVADEDALALAETLIQLLRAYGGAEADPRWDAVRSAGLATARRYTREAEAERLIEYWAARV